MEIFKLHKGPWKTIAEGMFQELPIKILMNPEEYVLVVIYDVKGKEIKGAAIQMYFPLCVEGSLEKAVESMPLNVVSFSKKEGDNLIKFAVVCGKPSYVVWKEDVFQKNVEELYKEVADNAKLFKYHAKVFGMKVKNLKDAGDEIKNVLLSEPLLWYVLSSALPKKEIRKAEKKLLVLGKTMDGKTYYEEVSYLKSCAIGEGDEEGRKKMVRVLCESFLLAGVPVIAFDFRNDFAGITAPNANKEEIYKFGINALEAIGFPAKAYNAAEDLKISLRYVDEEAFADIFKIGGNERKIVTAALKMREADTLDELIEAVNKTKLEFSNYEIKRSIRILHLIRSKYSALFSKDAYLEKLFEHVEPVGKISIINMGKLRDLRSMRLFVAAVLQAISNKLKGSYSKELIGAVVIQNAGEILRRQDNVSRWIINCLEELLHSGIGLILETETIALLPKKVKELIEAEISIVRTKPLDIAVRHKFKKPARILVRPTLSNI